MANLRLFRDRMGVYRYPRHLMTVPPEFMGTDKQPLVPHPTRRFYLADDYDMALVGEQFKFLGVHAMTIMEFIERLASMQAQIKHCPDQWHESVCLALCHHWKELSDNARRILLDLRIVPLVDGTWASASAGIYAETRDVRIPPNLEIRVLRRDIRQNSARYTLYRYLGAKIADAEEITKFILELHTRCKSVHNIPVPSLVSHARFLCTHQHWYRMRPMSSLVVIDEHGQSALGSDLYMDIPGEGRKHSMRSLFQGAAHEIRFIHPMYLGPADSKAAKEWHYWLRDTVKVNASPRVVNGQLSPEFEKLTKTLSTRDLLSVLSENWTLFDSTKSENVQFIARLSQVRMDDTENLCIGDGYLKTEDFDSFPDLPFLPVDDPKQPCWKFIEDLGVMTSPDCLFFLRRLRELKNAGCTDMDVMKSMYTNIAMHFYEDQRAVK